MARYAPAIKTIVFVILVPGTVTVLVPFLLVHPHAALLTPRLTPSCLLGTLLMAGGAALGLWCAGLFAFVGRGTPAPIDPPKRLVAVGPYRLVRNPMYVAVASILSGEAIFLWSVTLAFYAACVCTAFHLFVTLYEEPTLRRQFGDAYGEYCRDVPRWLPRFRK